MSLYFEAAGIINKVNAKKSSMKNLVYGSKVNNKKALYALVCETLKFQEILQGILTNVRLLEKEKAVKKNKDLATVLLYEHILGKGVSGHFKECFARHKSTIHSQCEILKIKHKITDLRQLVQANPGEKFPKYVRVNTLKTTRDKVIQSFENAGRKLLPCSKENFRDAVSSLSSKSFMQDPHVPDLLVFEPSIDLHKHPLYTSGAIILQDKASCFPAYILSPPAGSHVIDCCAAPGNKTSHLACFMQNKGKVFAFDKDKKRLETLQKLTTKAGASCIEATCADFLSVNPANNKYRNVQYVLVDPSCSGSGMINRSSQNTDETESSSRDRLKQLAKFQISIIKHALSFPAVKKVVYSTCSIHEEENEQVVEEILSVCGDTFELLHVEPDWPIRGVKGFEHAQSCLRMSQDACLTNGFFVACFQKKEGLISDVSLNVHNTGNQVLDILEDCIVTDNIHEGDVKSESKVVSEIKRKKRNKKMKRKLENECEMQSTGSVKKVKVTHTDSIAVGDTNGKSAAINEGDEINKMNHFVKDLNDNNANNKPSPLHSSNDPSRKNKQKKKKKKKAKQIVTCQQ